MKVNNANDRHARYVCRNKRKCAVQRQIDKATRKMERELKNGFEIKHRELEMKIDGKVTNIKRELTNRIEELSSEVTKLEGHVSTLTGGIAFENYRAFELARQDKFNSIVVDECTVCFYYKSECICCSICSYEKSKCICNEL